MRNHDVFMVAGIVETRRLRSHDLVVRSGSLLTHPATTDPAAFESLVIELTGDLTLESGAVIDVSGLGFPRNQTYPGEILPGNASGGSHLGEGGQYSTSAVASTFGSVYFPQEPGGGSEDPTYGRSGGGVVRISAADVNLVVGSQILANGIGWESGDHGSVGGAAGGSVWITASGTISGDGVIEAGGGLTGANQAGGGGGGAIAIEYGASAGTVLQNLSAFGGDTPVVGSGGTVYLFGPASVYGDLHLDNASAGTDGPVLPALGSGTAAAGTAGALLVTDRTVAIPAYFVGHWVEVSAADSTLKGTYRITSVNGVSATLASEDGSSIALEAGDLWRGVYRFDAVIPTGGTSLSSADPVFEGGMELQLSTTPQD